MIIIYLIAVYFIFIFIVLRLVVPYLGFTQTRVPEDIPQDLQNIIDEINKSSKNNYDFMVNAYSYITKRFHGSRFYTIKHWRYSFRPVFSHKEGYVPCNIHNFWLKAMLIKSGRFKEEDIKTETVFFNFFIHQSLRVNVDGRWIIVDPNSAYMGKRLGQRAIWFG